MHQIKDNTITSYNTTRINKKLMCTVGLIVIFLLLDEIGCITMNGLDNQHNRQTIIAGLTI